MILSRVPPQNVDAEKSVLGAMLLDKDAILMAEDKLTPEDFYREADAVIFKAILNLSHRGEPADILTVTEELKRMGRLDDVGGVLYINELPMNVISPKSVDRHADIVAGKAKLRRLIDAAGIIAEEAYSEQDAVEDITDNAESPSSKSRGMKERATSRRSGKPCRTSWKKFPESSAIRKRSQALRRASRPWML